MFLCYFEQYPVIAEEVAETSCEAPLSESDKNARLRIHASCSYEVELHYYLIYGGYVFTLFVCLSAGLRKNYSTTFTKLDGRVVHGARETIRFWWQSGSRYVRAGVRVELSGVKIMLRWIEDHGICLDPRPRLTVHSAFT